jgi:hypothetical protein
VIRFSSYLPDFSVVSTVVVLEVWLFFVVLVRE